MVGREGGKGGGYLANSVMMRVFQNWFALIIKSAQGSKIIA